MKYIVKRKEEYSISKWSGGTTSQIYIYPENSSFADRNFFYRISTASVNIDISDFSKLNGYKRYLMVLDGEMKLQHLGQHSAVLKPYDKDNFMGEWRTKCFGIGTDFNLMIKQDACGELNYIHFPYQKALCAGMIYAYYNLGESYTIQLTNGVTNDEIILSENDFLIISEIENNETMIHLHGGNISIVESIISNIGQFQ